MKNRLSTEEKKKKEKESSLTNGYRHVLFSDNHMFMLVLNVCYAVITTCSKFSHTHRSNKREYSPQQQYATSMSCCFVIFFFILALFAFFPPLFVRCIFDFRVEGEMRLCQPFYYEITYILF